MNKKTFHIKSEKNKVSSCLPLAALIIDGK